MSALRRWWQDQQYNPGPLGLVVNPFYFARRGLRQGLEAFLPRLRGEVLDIGCGRTPYRSLIAADRYVGVDIDTPATRALAAADVYYDGRTLPFADASFDAVLCSQVLEHVFAADAFVREIHRVLRPGGQLVLTVPFAWDEHEQPQDFARYSSFGLRALLERNGLAVVEHRKINAGPRALAQLTSGWVFKLARPESRWPRLAAQFALIAPINIAGAMAGAFLPAGEDFYLDHIVLAQKPPGADHP